MTGRLLRGTQKDKYMNNMKKITFITASLAKGGASKVVSQLSYEYVSRGYQVTTIVFSQQIEYGCGGDIVILGIPASKNFFVKCFHLLFRVIKLRRLLRERSGGRTLSFMESANIPTILTGYPVVISIHTNPRIAFGFMYKILIKWIYRFSNVQKIVCVSAGIEQSLHNEFGLTNTAVVYNPVDLDQSVLRSEDLSIYQPFILSVGRLVYAKNYSLLIRAFAKSRAKSEANLVIVGEGEERIMLEGLSKDLGVADRVYLVGKKESAIEYFRKASLFVLSSRYEGFGIVLLEALAFTPGVIATDCDFGPREIIKNKESGLLVPSEDEDVLAKAIDRLYFDTGLQKELAVNARETVKRFAIGSIADHWLKF